MLVLPIQDIFLTTTCGLYILVLGNCSGGWLGGFRFGGGKFNTKNCLKQEEGLYKNQKGAKSCEQKSTHQKNDLFTQTTFL